MIGMKLKKNCGVITLNPFKYAVPSIGTVSTAMIILLFIQIIMLAVTKSSSSLILLLVSVTASVSSECIYYFSHKFIKHAWRVAVIQGIITGLLIPSTYPVHAAFAVIFITFLLGKYVFGDFADSWANIIALCVVIMYFIDASFFPAFSVSASDLQSKNAALVLIQNGTVPVLNADSAVTDFLNNYVFKFFGVSIPEGYVSLFWDNGSVIPAFRFNLITIVSSIILISFDLIECIIPFIFLFIYAFLIRFISPFFVGGMPFQGDILLAFLTSGTLFCTLYLLQWYGTTPVSLWGKTVYGIISGIGGFFIIGFGTSSAGYVFLILIMNVISPVIQLFEDKRLYNNVSGKLVPLLRKINEV